MGDRKQTREIERAVGRIMKTVEKYDQIGKSEFEAILHKVMQQVHKNTGVEMDAVAGVTGRVIEDMPREYGQLSGEERTWESMVAYLYAKYLKELGRL